MLLAMFKKLLFTSLLALLPILIFTPLVAQGQGTYPVQGVVFDDKNGNGVQDGGEFGIGGKLIYADNTSSHQVRSNSDGSFRLDVPVGTHSIEIQNAGEGGSFPTTTQKIPVSSAQNVRFGIQQGGYDLVGIVRNAAGQPMSGATVYLDDYRGKRATTDQYGRYVIQDVPYDASQVIPGYQGGHNVYVAGYEETARALANPQSPVFPYERHDLNAVNPIFNPGFPTPQPGLPGGTCNPGSVVGSNTSACRNNTQEFCEVRNICSSDGRSTYPDYFNCGARSGQCGYTGTTNPFPTQPQCTPNTPTGQAVTQGCAGQYYCTLTPTYATGCQQSNVASNCELRNGWCGYTGPNQGQQPFVPANNNPFGTYSDGTSQLMGQQGFQDPFFDMFWSQPQQATQLFSAPAPVQSGFVDDPFAGSAGFSGWDSGFTSQIMQDSFSGSFNDTWSQMDTSFPGFDWSY